MNFLIGKNSMIFIIHLLNDFAPLLELAQSLLYCTIATFLFQLPLLLLRENFG